LWAAHYGASCTSATVNNGSNRGLPRSKPVYRFSIAETTCAAVDLAFSGVPKEAPDHIKANWPGVSWIIEMVPTTVTRRGHQVPRAHYFLSSLRTKSEALLRLIRQRRSIENEWHWPRDTQLHENVQLKAKVIGALLFCSCAR